MYPKFQMWRKLVDVKCISQNFVVSNENYKVNM